MSTKKYYKYNKENLKSALEAVKNGLPCATAAKQFNVPRTTLIGKIKGIYPEDCRSGASTVLTFEEEHLLVKWITNMGKMGFPVTKSQLLDSVTLLVKTLNRPNKFSDGRPGRHWFEGFIRRHPQISQRLTQNLTVSRAAVTKTKIQNWFREINEFFTSSNTDIKDPKRIFNTDESAFFLSPKGNKVLTKKGSKAVYDRSGDDKECLTVLVTGNAAGQLAPPMIMYPYERIPKHIILQVPAGWGIGKSDSGWMTSESFYEYISNIFYPWLVAQNIEFPVILYLDGHKSHVTMPLTKFCREKKIVIISLLPNSTHILQPLDVGLFRSLKYNWKKAINKFKIDNNHKILNRENFAPVLKQAFSTIPHIEVIFKNSFRVCGLYPFDSSNIDYRKLFPNSDITDSTTNKPAENPDIVKHLKFIEAYIAQNILAQFYNLRGADWEHDDENKNLYYTWYKIFKDSGLRFDIRVEEQPQITIEFEDGLVLEEGWDSMLVAEEENDTSLRNIKDTEIEEGSGNEERELDNDAIAENTESELYKEAETLKDNITKNKEKDIGENRLTSEKIEDTLEYIEKEKGIGEKHATLENIKDKPDQIEKEGAIGEKHATPEKIKDKSDYVEKEIEKAQEDSKITSADKQTEQESKKYENILPGITIPSPFKKSLFWPEPSTSKKSTKKRIKLPSVGTSDAWREYYLKKEEDNKRINDEREEKKRKREENKRLKEESVKNKRTRSEINKQKQKQSENNDDRENQLVVNEIKEPTNQQEFDKTEIVVNNFVIVNYLGDYYPGIITDLKDNKVFVSTMARSGLNKWKWPPEKDEIWYELDEIVEKIEPPEEINKRGFFEVKELTKYQKFVLD